MLFIISSLFFALIALTTTNQTNILMNSSSVLCGFFYLLLLFVSNVAAVHHNHVGMVWGTGVCFSPLSQTCNQYLLGGWSISINYIHIGYYCNSGDFRHLPGHELQIMLDFIHFIFPNTRTYLLLVCLLCFMYLHSLIHFRSIFGEREHHHHNYTQAV